MKPKSNFKYIIIRSKTGLACDIFTFCRKYYSVCITKTTKMLTLILNGKQDKSDRLLGL